MPRRQQCAFIAECKIPVVPYDFSSVPNCIATKESGLQASVLEEIVNRAEWTASVAELVGLSHEAADRRSRKTGSFRGIHHNNAEAERLSFSFITERTQTDDPIEGYMVRTKDKSRHLQGFLWFTNFTTWTHFFRWDSLASKAELHGRAQRDGISWDSDGLLSSELELQHRDGDPNDQGVIWPRVAEIALVGGLECGGFLVQLALEALEHSMAYDFVVVQATESSAGFYDRMGFRRVGALAKYITSDVAPHQARTVAYRHWAYPDEDVSKMDSSIMMAVKLRAGQVVKRVMPQEGGIFPNRHRFMERVPSRGVLSARPRTGAMLPPHLASSCDANLGAAPSPDTVNVASTCAEVPESSPGHESLKEGSRRSQACRAWVCYGNPSATILSPKRRRDVSSNQLHRSGAPITMQSNPGSTLIHTALTAENRGQFDHLFGSGEVRPCPRAPRGMFRPSKRKSCGDPCISVDLEPTGTAPESDLQPAGVAIPSLAQRPRRDRSALSLERRYADYITGSLPSPARTVAVAVRSYPPAEVPLRDSAAIGQTASSLMPTAVMEMACSNLSTAENVQSADSKITQGNPEKLAELNAAEVVKGFGDINDVCGGEENVSQMETMRVQPVSSNRPVAIRRYPPPIRKVDLRNVGDAGRTEDTRSASRKAVLTSVTRRLRRSKPYLTLRARYAARARAAKERAAAMELSTAKSCLVEKLELGSLPLNTRPRVERVVPDLLSAAGVVSTKGPFDCDDDANLASLPALAVPVKTRCEGADAMTLPTLEGVDFFERCTCFELMIAGEDRPCCDFCTRRKDDLASGNELHEAKKLTIVHEENDAKDTEDIQRVQSKEKESEESGSEEAGLARDRQPRRRIPVSKFRFHQLNLRIYPRKGGSHSAKLTNHSDQIARAKQSAARSQTRSWRERNPALAAKGANKMSTEMASTSRHDTSTDDSPSMEVECDSSDKSSENEGARNDKESGDEGVVEADTDSEESPFVANLTFPSYPWACEDDGEAVADQVWRPMICPFVLVDGVVHALKGYDAVAPIQGNRSLVVGSGGLSKVASIVEKERLEDGSDAEDVAEDVKCDGCGRADREDEMVLCDECDSGWHLDCLKPALLSVPDGEWICPDCSQSKTKLVASRCSKVTSLNTYVSNDPERSKTRSGVAGTASLKQSHACDTEAVRLVPSRQRQPVVRFKFHRTIQDDGITVCKNSTLKTADSQDRLVDPSRLISTAEAKSQALSDMPESQKASLTPSIKTSGKSCISPATKSPVPKSPAAAMKVQQSQASSPSTVSKPTVSKPSSPSTVSKPTLCKAAPPAGSDCSPLDKKNCSLFGTYKSAAISRPETTATGVVPRGVSLKTENAVSGALKSTPVPSSKGIIFAKASSSKAKSVSVQAPKSTSSTAMKCSFSESPGKQPVIFSPKSSATSRLSHHKRPVNIESPRSHATSTCSAASDLSCRGGKEVLLVQRNIPKSATDTSYTKANRFQGKSGHSLAAQRLSSDHAVSAGATSKSGSIRQAVVSRPSKNSEQKPSTPSKTFEVKADGAFWDNVRSESLRRVCEDMGVPVSGNREALIARIMARVGGGRDLKVSAWLEELSGVRMSTLRRVCSDLSVSMSGNKETLICRLLCSKSDGDLANGQINVGGSCAVPDYASVWQEWPCDGCGRADREDEMVLCDACDAGWHLDCLSPALAAVPDGDWLCPECAVANRVAVMSGASQGHKAACSDGSRKRVRYAMLRNSSGRTLDHFDQKAARKCRTAAPVKRQRVPVARFRFSSIESSAAQQ